MSGTDDLSDIIEAAQGRLSPMTPWQRKCQNFRRFWSSVDWSWILFCVCIAGLVTATVVQVVAIYMKRA